MTLKTRVEVTTNQAETQRVFVRFADKDAKRRATKMLKAAKREAPVSKLGPTGTPGFLRDNIRMTQSRDTRGRWSSGYDVTSNAPYTLYVIKGTRPHRIPRAGSTAILGFFWAKTGQFVVFHSVQHPGTKANNFLQRALRAGRSGVV